MSEKNFPAVQAKSPSEALKMLGIDEGAILEYNPASGMYVVSIEAEDEDIGPRDGEYSYSYFAEAVGFSKKVIDALLESGVVEEILVAEEEKGQDEAIDGEVTIWDKAELTMVCGRCGAEEKVVDAVGGVSLFMPSTSEAETRLVCNECDNRMSLLYRNGAMMTDEEKAEFKAKQMEQEAQHNKANEVPDEAFEKVEEDEPQEKSE